MRARALLVVPLVVVAVGCSFVDDYSHFHTDGGPDGGPGDLGVDADAGHALTLAEFTAMYAAGTCAHAVYCESKLGIVAFLELFCNPDVAGYFFGVVGGVLPPTVTFDPAAARVCLDALSAGDPHDCSVTQATMPAVCQHVVVGSAANGTHCHFDAECASGNCADPSSCGGTCAPTGTLPMGATCAHNSDCAGGLRCRTTQCLPPGAVSQPCDENEDCVDLTWCDSATSTCQPLPDIGQHCDLSLGGDPCRNLQVCTGPSGATVCADGGTLGAPCDLETPCQPGLRCSDTTHMCKTLSGPDGPCTSKENCPLGFTCTAMACRPLPGLGSACTPITPCVIGSCVSGTCAVAPTGTTCDLSASLAAPCVGYCDATSMMCHDALPSGATCTTDEECGAGASCTGTPARTCTPCP